MLIVGRASKLLLCRIRWRFQNVKKCKYA